MDELPRYEWRREDIDDCWRKLLLKKLEMKKLYERIYQGGEGQNSAEIYGLWWKYLTNFTKMNFFLCSAFCLLAFLFVCF